MCEKRVISGPGLLEWEQEILLGMEDCRYTGNLISGARILQYVTDCFANLTIRRENDGGLLAYSDINLKAAVYVCEFLQIHVKIVHVGNRSRKAEYRVYKTVSRVPGEEPGVCNPPELVAYGTLVAVVKKPLN